MSTSCEEAFVADFRMPLNSHDSQLQARPSCRSTVGACISTVPRKVVGE